MRVEPINKYGFGKEMTDWKGTISVDNASMIMPIQQNKPNYPEWNPNDRQASIMIFGNFIHEMAMNSFLQDKYHPQVIISLYDDKVGKDMYTVPSEQSQEDTVRYLKDKIQANNLYGIIHIFTGITHFPEEEHTIKQWVSKNLPDNLPAGQTKETLVVNIQSRDIIHTFIDEIVRYGDEVCFGKHYEAKNLVAENMERLFGKK